MEKLIQGWLKNVSEPDYRSDVYDVDVDNGEVSKW
jgi:hypothetical protein